MDSIWTPLDSSGLPTKMWIDLAESPYGIRGGQTSPPVFPSARDFSFHIVVLAIISKNGVVPMSGMFIILGGNSLHYKYD